MRSTILLFALLVVVPGMALAAKVPALSPRARVRLSAPSLHPPRQIGILVGITTDSIRINPDQGGAELAIARQDLGRLEVSRGLGRHTLKGAEIGLVLGGGLGTAIGAGSDAGLGGTGTSILIGAVLLGGLGLAIGTGFGALNRTEGWTRVQVSALPTMEWQEHVPEPVIRVGLTLGL